jgi:hypothetical protein
MDTQTTLPARQPAEGGLPSHALFGVRVRFTSDVLGEGYLQHERNDPTDVFPKGHLTRIFNLPARRMANATVEDGKERRWGMWEVTPLLHSPNA